MIFVYSRNIRRHNLEITYAQTNHNSTFDLSTRKLITLESAYHDAVYNDILERTISSYVFYYFYISRVVILVGYNDNGYNDNSDTTMLFLNKNYFFYFPIEINLFYFEK